MYVPRLALESRCSLRTLSPCLRGVSRFSNFFLFEEWDTSFSHIILYYIIGHFSFENFFTKPPLSPPPPKKPSNFNVFKNNSSLSIFDIETWKLFYFVHNSAFYNSTILIIEICLPKNIYDEKKK